MCEPRARRGAFGITGVGWVIVVVAMLVAGCGAVPNNSSPQPIKSFQREGPTDAVPVPQSDMDPEALVRSFLKATADPKSGHRAARKFLTPASSKLWDDRGDALILDEISIFVDQRNEDVVRMRVIGDNYGTLHANGQLIPADGRVETSISLVRVRGQWRIDGALPRGSMVDRDQFEASYRPVSLYFADRAAQHLVPDPRWLYAGENSDPTVLVNRLIAGPSTDLAGAVGNALPPGTALRGPVTPLSGGGVRIELTGLGNPSNRDRTTLAAQIVWTLSGAEVSGPYVINADGAPLVAERASGWQTADVSALDPTAVPATEVGLDIVSGGALLAVAESATTPVPGPLGVARDVVSADISADGTRVAAVSGVPGRTPRYRLSIGDYGGDVAEVIAGRSITRPSFGAGPDTVWAVVDGRPMRWLRDGQGTSMVPVDTSAVAGAVRGDIGELQIAPDGVRAALLVAGQVVFAVVSMNADGQVSLTSPRIAAYNIGNRVVSIAWASSTTLMVAREAPDSPVVQLSVNGTPAVGLLSGNVSPPVRAVAANSTTVYVGDQRGVLRLGSTNGQPDQYWTEVEPAMIPGAVPLLP
ncbi:MtrAB system accessory lipoprotein LpqB [Gordonia sp. ABSL1-1]|uniref:MtrAB system accessory lipoprotein LpqB n=1 Tax=Gordonia sp. ABSL1-1 TaxID=3053923 RepID=UPI00257287FE|nr:MtrAB system accessory lipoprotein LpqB [Gordonia sp. ABSL1-1]MDL9936725.1 MtrAB system accessory lipoprotein LpqB [Gordonia sp. ABSL1-1]